MELNIKDTAKAGNNIEIEIFKADGLKRTANGDIESGTLIGKILARNLNTNVGLNFMRKAISRVVTPMAYIACGTGSTPAAAGDTTLGTEIDRVAILAYDDPSTGAVRFRAIFESNQGNGNLIEFGLLNAAIAGELQARSVLGAAFTKDTTLVLRVNWTVTLADT